MAREVFAVLGPGAKTAEAVSDWRLDRHRGIHLAIGPGRVFVIDTKQWTGCVHQSADGLIWHNHYRLDRALATIYWQAGPSAVSWGIPVAPLLCVHDAHVQGGGLRAQGVAIVPATRLRSALGFDRVLVDAEVELYAATAKALLRPAAGTGLNALLSWFERSKVMS